VRCPTKSGIAGKFDNLPRADGVAAMLVGPSREPLSEGVTVNSQNRWKIATIIAAIVAAMGWASAPASSHVAGWAHNWTEHIKPRADARYYPKAASDLRYFTRTAADDRYYTKAQSESRYAKSFVPFGGTISGVWSVSAPSGSLGLASITFHPKLPTTVTPHFLPDGFTGTAECPGFREATPGHLCVYEGDSFNMTFDNFRSPTSGAIGAVLLEGTVLTMTSAHAQGNARGTWTVRAPLTSARVAP
jgi:hypothetical protein